MHTDLPQAFFMDKKKTNIIIIFIYSTEISEAGGAICPPAGEELFSQSVVWNKSLWYEKRSVGCTSSHLQRKQTAAVGKYFLYV